MFRGELGGKINEDLKDGRKKPVDSSGYKKPEILEEKDKEKVVEFEETILNLINKVYLKFFKDSESGQVDFEKEFQKNVDELMLNNKSEVLEVLKNFILKKNMSDFLKEEMKFFYSFDPEKNVNFEYKIIIAESLPWLFVENYFAYTNEKESIIFFEEFLKEKLGSFRFENLIKKDIDLMGKINKDLGWEEYYKFKEDNQEINSYRAFLSCFKEKIKNKENFNYKKIIEILIQNTECAFLEISYHIDDVCYIFNQEPSFSSELLLKKIKETNNDLEKTLLTRFLYHLEFGKIGMSEEGIKYLDKTFDLGSDNSKQGFAHRVTGDGKVAIFDDDNKIKGYFELSNLDSDEKTVKTQMHQITYETLFYSQKNETEKQKQEREKILEEFKEKYFATYLDKSGEFYKKTGVAFNNLGFKEQGMFLNFVSQANEEDKKRALEFIKKYKEEGFQAFLSMQSDLEDGEKILQIGEKIEEKNAEKIFALISNYLKWVEKKNEEISEEFFTNDKNQDFESFRQKIIQKAHETISSFAKVINEKNTKEETKKLFSELDDSKTELIVLGFALKDAKEKGIKVSLDELKNTSLDIKNVLDEKEKEEMLKITKINWKSKGQKGKVVIEEFEKDLKEKKNSDYWILKNSQEDLLAFMRYDKTNLPNHYHASSFNVNPDCRGSALGEGMRKTAFEKMASQYIIDAEADPEDTIGFKYVEEDGFFITGAVIDEKKGDEYLKISCDKKELDNYKSREINKEDFIKNIDNSGWNGDILVKWYDPTKESKIILKTIQKAVSLGYIGTRYFEHNGKRIYVFEKKKTKDSSLEKVV